MQKKVFITGINKGLGKELFDLFASKNYFVYGIHKKNLTKKNYKIGSLKIRRLFLLIYRLTNQLN